MSKNYNVYDNNFERVSEIRLTGLMKYNQEIEYYASRYYDMFFSKMMELLPYLITYENLPTTLDPVQIETYLRLLDRDLIIGEDKHGRLVVLGHPTALSNNFYQYPIVEGIEFIIPKEQQLDSYEQLTPNNPDEGNYVLLRNKYNPYISNDIRMIELAALTIAKIKKSRYSIITQSHILTYFKGENMTENKNVHNIMDSFYKGAPYLLVESAFDVENMVGSIQSASNIPSILNALNIEADTEFNSLLNFIGVLNTGIIKASGTNEFETKANQGLLNSIDNIYIKTRESSFRLLNHKYKTDIKISVDANVRTYIDEEMRPSKQIETGDKNEG